MKYRKINKEILFELICKIAVDVMNPGYPTSIPNYASLLGTSKYQVRKYMKELEKDGLVKSICMYYDGRPDYETGELWDDPCVLRGWEITEKVKGTETYKKEAKEMHELIEKIWGGD